MQIDLLSFGSLTEIIKNGRISAPTLVDTDSIRNYLIAQYPLLATKKFVLAVNGNIILQNTKFEELDTVALLPPFSGG